MKILFIQDRGFEFGGGETYILSLRKELTNQGHEVKILSSNLHKEKGLFSDFTFHGSDNFVLRWIYPLVNPWAVIKLYKVLHEYQPDMIHLHGICEQTSYCILPLLKGLPTVLTTHDNDLVGPGENKYAPHVCSNYYKGEACRECTSLKGYLFFKVKNFIRKDWLKYIDRFITTNGKVEKALNHWGINNVVKIPYGIKLLKYSKITHYNELLYVGRLAEQKGVKYLLEAMPYIIYSLPNTRLSIVGTGPEEQKLKNLSKRLKLNKYVKFLGFHRYSEIQKYYRQTTILIVTSIWQEPFGLIGPEAMSVGRPIIATKVGGIPEWIDDNNNGYLVEPMNSKELAINIAKLLSNKQKIITFGKYSRIKAERDFCIHKHVSKIVNLYKEVIKNYI